LDEKAKLQMTANDNDHAYYFSPDYGPIFGKIKNYFLGVFFKKKIEIQNFKNL